MPALITHYLFGEEAINRGAAAGIVDPGAVRDERRSAFYLGCQGPDPLFFAVTTPRGSTLRALARAMHQGKVAPAFERIRAAVGDLEPKTRPLGRAFGCGMLAHYVLDRAAHPYVHALGHELEAADPALATARREVHAILESEIDCGVLDHYRGCSTAHFIPMSVLEKDGSAALAGGRLLGRVAQDVFGLNVRPNDYAGALDDMRLCYQAIEPAGSARSQRIGAVERLLRAHSHLESLAHRPELGAGNPAMNPQGRTWVDPFTKTASNENFAELFERALDEYSTAVQAWLEGAPLDSVVRGLDYSGRPAA